MRRSLSCLALLLALPGVAEASPDDDVITALAMQALLDVRADAFLSLAPESRWRTAWALEGCGSAPEALQEALAVECARDPAVWSPLWSARPAFSLLGGDYAPDNNSGDEEAGLVGLRVGAVGAIYSGPFVIRATPVVGVAALDVEGTSDFALLAGATELWAGADIGRAWLGGGRQDRWLGPARRGTLVLSDNAVPPWMVNGGLDGHLPGLLANIGRFRAEVGVGVLAEARADVDNPGLLMMDLRWLPIPELELGFNRLSIFGGEGRPDVDIGQLIIPSEPHIYDDPDLELPDQNELASLHVRVNVPLRKRWNLPIDHVSGWWEYGGEDMIMRDFAGVDYPALAGVGNLYGGEISVRPVVVTGEYSQLMDDYFRWYVGHRVYHQGFTQSGRVLGNLGGPDSENVWGQVSFFGADWRARVDAEWTHRVGVVESRAGNVFTLPTDEERVRVGLSADHRRLGAWWTAGYSIASTTGRDYTRGNDFLEHRVVFGMTVGPEFATGASPPPHP